MAKGVLGNDPFLRGAPARKETALQTPARPAPPTPEPEPPRPARPRKPPRPAAAGKEAPAPGPRGWPKAAKATREHEPARASVRVMMSKKPPVLPPVLGDPPERLRDWEPTSHPGSPQMVVLVDGVPTPHSGSPELIAQLNQPPNRIREFVPHPNSPELKGVLPVGAPGQDRHPGPSDAPGPGSPAPRAKGKGAAPTQSPAAAGANGKQAVPHPASPAAVAALGRGEAVPHSASPAVVATLARGEAVAHPASPEVVADLQQQAPVQHAASPEVVAKLQSPSAVQHAASPEVVAKLQSPSAVQHAASPEVVADLQAPSTVQHAASPEVIADLQARSVVQHAASPEVIADLQARSVVQHPASPEVMANLRAPSTVQHRASPEVVADLRAPSTVQHRASPEVVAKLQSPSAVQHAASPEVAAKLESPSAVQHAASPEVVAKLGEAGPVQHARSPEALEVQSASRRRPLVVEIVEETQPQAPMSAREISPGSRSRGPMVALGVAREIFSGGVVRPLAGAARGIFQAARTAIGINGGAELDVWGKDLSLSRSLEPLAAFLYDRYFRVTVEGADHVPAGASILVANHSGALPLDGPMLHLALRRERADLPDVRWLMEDQVFHAPFVGVLANRLGAVRANPENATRLLEEKRPVAVFPEGIQGISKKFGERYQLKRFGRGGYVKLAVRLNAPIVPVAIVGAEESLPLLARLPGGPLGLPYLPITVPPLPARWHIRFGQPLGWTEAPDNADEDLAWVANTNDRVRATIEGMLISMLRARTSVF